jgi:hypothetical protein
MLDLVENSCHNCPFSDEEENALTYWHLIISEGEKDIGIDRAIRCILTNIMSKQLIINRNYVFSCKGC